MAGRTVCMLIASFTETRGGAERQCRLLSEHLVDAGVDVTVLTR